MNKHKLLTDTFFENATLLGSPIFYGIVLLFFAKTDSHMLIRTAAALAAVEAISAAIKISYRRERPIPEKYGNGLLARWASRSFPSVHSARAITVAIAISKALPGDAPVIALGFSAALLVGLSRVYLGKHDWKDVLGGFAIGAVSGILLIWV